MNTFDPFEPTNEEIAAMENFRAPVCMALALAATNSVAFAQPSGTAIPVTGRAGSPHVDGRAHDDGVSAHDESLQ